MVADYDAELKRYTAAGQAHVFEFWDTLNSEERNALLASTSSIDIARATRVFATSTSSDPSLHAHSSDPIEPLPDNAFDSTIGAEQAARVEEWRSVGLGAIARNEVGVLLMAGGQGTRLGSTDPKGCYDIGLPSHKPLFQLQAERIRRLQSVAERKANKTQGSVVIPWYIMTSGPTRPATEAFFAKHNYFGLDPANIIIFEQGTLPCFTFDGKVILASPSEIATAPDGNGGLYASLRRPLSPSPSAQEHTVLTDLAQRGISFIHAYGVDNCLVRVADPVFLGYSLSHHADCAAKVVRKAAPDEAVGVVALKGSVFSVVEYSEITQEQAYARDRNRPDQLAFRAANIVNHFYTRAFLEKVEGFEAKMAFHVARKKIPFVSSTSPTTTSSNPGSAPAPAPRPTGSAPYFIKPTKPNGIKLELFVFDVFPFAQRMVVLEVERSEEFSPLKNAPGTGSDDPETSRRDLLALGRKFLERAGAKVVGAAEEEGDVTVEVSPLVTYAGEGLESVRGKTFSRSGHVESVEELDALVCGRGLRYVRTGSKQGHFGDLETLHDGHFSSLFSGFTRTD